MKTLRDYQSMAVDRTFEEWKTVRSTLVVAPTGSGKSRIAAEIIKNMLPKRSIFVAHRQELIWQARNAIDEVLGQPMCEIEMAELYAMHQENRDGPVVAMVQSLNTKNGWGRRMDRFDPMQFGLVVIDECFPAGTPVDGKPIESIKIGESVKTHRGHGRVTHTFKKETDRICVVTFDNKETLVCTPNHPIWTTRGFIPAGFLTRGCVVATITSNEQLHHLPKTIGCESLPRQERQDTQIHNQDLRVVSVRQRDEASENPEDISEIWRRNNPISEAQWHGKSGSSSQGLHETSGNGLGTESQKGERPRSDDTRDCAGVISGMAMQCGCRYQSASSWFSELLQAGRWEFRFEDWGGDRWFFSRNSGASGEGQKEGGLFAFSRVESVKVYEQGSGEEFEFLCPKGVVYNLEVSNGNTYFANGVLVHNCHHSVADSYKAVLGHFKRNPALKVLGLTATPDRLDEEALGQICDSVAFDYEILDAINDGWLTPIEQVMVPVEGLDFSHIKTVAGDLNQSDLAAVMEAESVIQGVVQPTLELMFGIKPHTLDNYEPLKWGQFLGESGNKPKRTLIFTVSVAQAEMLSNVFNRVIDGISEWVCGKTADDKRVDLLQRYNDGEIAVMVNCNCLSEGFDSPGVELIVQARPTKSRSLYAQQVGRATRPLPGIVDGIETAELRKLAIQSSSKPVATIVDFVGNSGRHKLISSVDILAGNVSDEAIEFAKKALCKSSTPVRVTDAIKDAEEELRLELEKRRREQEAKKARVVARSKYSIRFVNPFDALDIVPVKTRGWDEGKKISSKQAAVLERNKVDPGTLSYAQARQVLNEIFARSRANQCSLGQANVLKRYRLPISVSRKQASAWLDELAKNRWCITNNLKQQQQAKVEEPLPF